MLLVAPVAPETMRVLVVGLGDPSANRDCLRRECVFLSPVAEGAMVAGMSSMENGACLQRIQPQK